MKKTPNIPNIRLYNGQTIPQFGLGVYQIPNNDECEKVCLEAFKLGYRHIDTAHIYQNERGVGAAIKKKWNTKGTILYNNKIMDK